MGLSKSGFPPAGGTAGLLSLKRFSLLLKPKSFFLRLASSYFLNYHILNGFAIAGDL
jgi:hypothetical protein